MPCFDRPIHGCFYAEVQSAKQITLPLDSRANGACNCDLHLASDLHRLRVLQRRWRIDARLSRNSGRLRPSKVGDRGN